MGLSSVSDEFDESDALDATDALDAFDAPNVKQAFVAHQVFWSGFKFWL